MTASSWKSVYIKGILYLFCCKFLLLVELFYRICKQFWTGKAHTNIFILLCRRDLRMEWQEIEVVCVADIFFLRVSLGGQAVDKSGMDCVVL